MLKYNTSFSVYSQNLSVKTYDCQYFILGAAKTGLSKLVCRPVIYFSCFNSILLFLNYIEPRQSNVDQIHGVRVKN